MLRSVLLASAALAVCSAKSASVTVNATAVHHLDRVLATFSCPGCTAGAFLAVYSPANASTAAIAPQPYPAEAPWTAAAAAKWIPLSAITGNTFVFSCTNSFEDMAINLFNGSETEPELVASSGPISFLDIDAPLRGHLARTASPSEMNVTWHSRHSDASARVKFGTASGVYTGEAAVSYVVTYDVADMAGAPANGMGWFPSHVWLTATITGLTPGSAAPIFYVYGSDEHGWSGELSFLPPPAVGAQTTKILLLADVGTVRCVVAAAAPRTVCTSVYASSGQASAAMRLVQ